ncbi:MAG TPA: MFS transporter [Polyangiaceae bacterium]|jgi:MFS family permease
MPSAPVAAGTVVQTNIPQRLDRLPWSAWHLRVVLALGVTWTLDGLEASLVTNLGPILEERSTLGLTATQVGVTNAVYLVGQVVGALAFGRLTDLWGRKRLFLVTLAIYLGATGLSGLAPGLGVFCVFRFFAGTGIGGEYAAINSAIDELIPARLRGRVDLAVNGSYWIGVVLGACVTQLLLDPRVVPQAWGWRLAFLLGSVLGLGILFVRRHMPESPRWLLMHGRIEESEASLRTIETAVAQSHGELPEAPPRAPLRVTGAVGILYTARVLLKRLRRRTVLGLALMVAQTLFYNAVFFSLALVLTRFYGVPVDHAGRYVIPFAVGNFFGPVLLGHFFDVVGRRVMIASTYVLSGALLVASGYAFQQGWLDATTQTVSWCVVFFFASAAASSAYLTVSELFPVEIRGMAIALFYATATLVGASSPALLGALIESGSRPAVFHGYVVGAAAMIAAGIVAAFLGVPAEGKSLEQLQPTEAGELPPAEAGE